jgi:hypothetical protein
MHIPSSHTPIHITLTAKGDDSISIKASTLDDITFALVLSIGDMYSLRGIGIAARGKVIDKPLLLAYASEYGMHMLRQASLASTKGFSV